MDPLAVSGKSVKHQNRKHITISNRVIYGKEKAINSWWMLPLTREEFMARAVQESERMSKSKEGQRKVIDFIEVSVSRARPSDEPTELESNPKPKAREAHVD